MTNDLKTCEDFDECLNNDTCTSPSVCFNTLGGYRCIEIELNNAFWAWSQKAGGADSDAVQALESKVSTLSTSLTTGIIWIVILSLALVIVGAASFRRWRKDGCGGKGNMESETGSNVDNWETTSNPESQGQAEASQEDVFVDVDLAEPAQSTNL